MPCILFDLQISSLFLFDCPVRKKGTRVGPAVVRTSTLEFRALSNDPYSVERGGTSSLTNFRFSVDPFEPADSRYRFFSLVQCVGPVAVVPWPRKRRFSRRYNVIPYNVEGNVRHDFRNDAPKRRQSKKKRRRNRKQARTKERKKATHPKKKKKKTPCSDCTWPRNAQQPRRKSTHPKIDIMNPTQQATLAWLAARRPNPNK